MATGSASVSSWLSSPTSPAAKSPALSASGLSSDGVAGLHATLSSLSLSPGANSSSERAANPEYAQQRPAPTRSTSNTSAGQGSAAVAAIGSGRSGSGTGAGTSPPARNNVAPGEPSQLESQAQHSAQQHLQQSLSPGNQHPFQSYSHSPAHLQHQPSYAARNSHPRDDPRNNNNSTSNNPLSNGNGNMSDADHPATSPGVASDSNSRFALSQPQFNLDHALLAKSREQRDLDDVDSGQRASATLWMGDLEAWMDESYIRRCISALGWDRDENGNQTIEINVKMIKSVPATSGYCFITFPTSSHASSVLAHFSKQPPMLMPGSERTFKLNWATGLPGVQPKWEGEYSVFVGDLGREVTEGELVALFTPLFPSTKSAKIMYDPATGLSRGYGFVRFGEESDMQRSLALGQNTAGSGLSLRGRTLRISEASGSGSRNRTTSTEASGSNALHDGQHQGQGRNQRDLQVNVPHHSQHNEGKNQLAGTGPAFDRHANGLLSPSATGFSIPIASPTSPLMSPSYGTSPLSPSADPNNTTVFVGGLPASINEDTLRSFFQHFGEITYVKVPPNKGCGFVQFVRRADAELAIAKMHDFPIHGKNRIRLSWGRSQGDKQVEHVKKLAGALNVPFEAVWRMVQGHDNSTIKQIATAVGAGPGVRNRPDPETARADFARLSGLAGAYAQNGATLPAGLPARDSPLDGLSPMMSPNLAGPVPSHETYRPAVPQALSPEQFGWAGPPPDRSGPYSRVSPSTFAPMATSNLSGHPPTTVPFTLSPSPGPGVGMYAPLQAAQPAVGAGPGGPYVPYTPVAINAPAGISGSLSPSIEQVVNSPLDSRPWKPTRNEAPASGQQPNGLPSSGMQDFFSRTTNRGAAFENGA